MEPKCVLVVGASGGIGRAIALRFAAPQTRLALHCATNERVVHALAAQCRLGGADVSVHCAAMDDAQHIVAMRDALDARCWHPDVLVYAAGVGCVAQVQDVTEAMWERTFSINVRGFFQCIQAFVPNMLAKRRGRIIVVSSIWGERGASCESVYAASKGALHALVRSVALECAPSGVTVNAVAPGAIDVGMMHAYGDETTALVSEAIPCGRLGRAEEVADVVHFVARPESGYITGQVLSINGGWGV
ncbi:MAG: SDR family oxidoreductase [Paenibacillaceae bacterium]|nr:SDR family oxidoreductase [Paenibacillaceae bacterium]